MKMMHSPLAASAELVSHASFAIADAMRGGSCDTVTGRHLCATGTWAYGPSIVKPSFQNSKNAAFTATDHSQRTRLT